MTTITITLPDDLAKQAEEKGLLSQTAFDYRAAATAKSIPPEVLRSLEDKVARDFPSDPMLRELHILRAINAYGER